MNLALSIVISAALALVIGSLGVLVILAVVVIKTVSYPSEKEAMRRTAADLLEARRRTLSDEETRFLERLRWRSPANRFFWAAPMLFGMISLCAFAACFYWLRS
jgi:hypothetical protein